MRKFLLLALLAGVVSMNSAFASPPAIVPIDLGNKAGTKIACEGNLYRVDNYSSWAGSGNSATVVMVDKCKPLEFARAAYCRTAGTDITLLAKYQKLNQPSPNDVSSLVIASLQKQYPSKWAYPDDILYSQEYRVEFDKQWDALPHARLKIEGTLESCVNCADCDTVSSCMIAQCTPQLKDPAEEKGK